MGINPYNSTNWYPEDLPKPDIKPSNKYATWIWLGLVALIVMALAAYIVLASVGRKLGCLLTDCRSNPVAASLSWDEQFAIGRAAALKEDPEGIVEYITAHPFAKWPRDWTVSNTLKLSLMYQLPSMSSFTIEYDDATQDSNPHIYRDKFGGTPLPIDQNRSYYQSQAITDTLAVIEISPRDAEIATWAKASAEAKNDGVDITPYISLNFVSSASNKHPSWDVTYWPVPVDNPPDLFAPLRALLEGSYSSQFTVDATTGEITKTDLGPKLQVTKR